MLKTLPIVNAKTDQRRHPSWIKARIPGGGNYAELKKLMRDLQLHTVCEEARCPNIGECWNSRTATFMILGDVCTRRCMFCAVKKGAPGGVVDTDEPRRLGEAVGYLKLKHIVITSVNRDDLTDGGASVFAECIAEARKHRPGCTVEVLIPDLEGNWDALKVIVQARPEVLNHNTETVQRLYRRVRPYANYQQTLTLLEVSKQLDAQMLTKSGVMVGLGETVTELLETMQDIRNTGCDIFTIGQYLSPSPRHLPIQRYYTPEEFDELREVGVEMGFRHVESGPLVRSSYHAGEQASLEQR
ncbi:lipoyl synthase [Candidatus Poribacteria bacterium]|nr:lipoyl synthase [Candidatus Poribacteria bacterium]MYB00225.1 lipoyl synthase [Candidatus Poribacteria bacterium]